MRPSIFIYRSVLQCFMLLSMAIYCNAQKGTLSAGGIAAGAGGTVYYSIGQVDYKTRTGAGGKMTEGLQQPIILLAPLPINLRNFIGYCNEGKIHLSWETLSENNNESFTMEKSLDGNKWISFANIPGAINSNELKVYSLTDVNPFETAGYYRIKQNDVDGNNGYSNAIYLRTCTEGLQMLSIYPNPTKDGVFISVNGVSDISCEIRDQLGNFIRRETVSGKLYYLDMKTLPSANYLISLFENGNPMNTYKIIKD